MNGKGLVKYLLREKSAAFLLKKTSCYCRYTEYLLLSSCYLYKKHENLFTIQSYYLPPRFKINLKTLPTRQRRRPEVSPIMHLTTHWPDLT